MEGWIRYFLRNGTEPLRLAFLLIGKTAFESGDDCGFESPEFPYVINEFLKARSLKRLHISVSCLLVRGEAE
ncbi:hypothetical protein CRYUN_Cryun37aG0086100 [Craigia yunnanensis]